MLKDRRKGEKIEKEKHGIGQMTYITIWLVLLVAITSVPATIAYGDNDTTVPVTYVSYIDDKLGFYKVIDVTLHKDSPYKERVLTINQGDTIVWLNDADTAILTVVSEENLWDKTESKLGSTSRRFNYTFMIPETYSVCIDGYENIVCQTIIIDPVEGYPTPTPSPTPRPAHTQIKEIVEMSKGVPNSTSYPVKDMNKSKNSTVNSTNNDTSEKGTDLSCDISWDTIIDFINAITGILVAISALLITYKIFRDY